MRALVNERVAPADVPPPVADAAAFHRTLAGYAPTPVRDLPELARELGVAAVVIKDESSRLGLPAFKILGASWAVERALGDRADTNTLVAASAGNHGRAVAHIAEIRGLRSRIFLPERALSARRDAIAAEGADVVVVDGTYEDAVAAAEAEAEKPGHLLVSDVGREGPPAWVIDGYATLFSEAHAQAEYDLLLVPVGVGSLAAAAARHGSAVGARGRRRTGIGSMPHRVARLRPADDGRHAGHGDGGPRLRGGVGGCVAFAPGWCPRHAHRPRRRSPRRNDGARRVRTHDRRERRSTPRRPPSACAQSGLPSPT
jgi:threonine dehydratase